MLRALEPMLFAQASAERLPAGKAVLMIAFFGFVGVACTLGLFASNETLESLAGIIGTKKPIVARIACGVGAAVGFFTVFACVMDRLGKL